MSDSFRLDFISQRYFNIISWDKRQFLWKIYNQGDQYSFASDSSLRKMIDSAIEYNNKDCVTPTIAQLEEDFKLNDRFRRDRFRLEFLEKRIFNLIKFSPVHNLWQIGDDYTNIYSSYDLDLRKAIDRLIF